MVGCCRRPAAHLNPLPRCGAIYAWLLANQLTDAVLVLIFIARPIPPMNVANLALAVDEDRNRHFLLARTAPGGPEIDHDDLALVLAQRGLLAGQRGQGK